MSETESREVFNAAGENSTDVTNVIENKEMIEAAPKRGRRSKDIVGNMNA